MGAASQATADIGLPLLPGLLHPATFLAVWQGPVSGASSHNDPGTRPKRKTRSFLYVARR